MLNKCFKITPLLLSLLFVTSCGTTDYAKKGYEESKTFLRSAAANYGYSPDSIRFLYCDYVYFDDSNLAKQYPIYGDGIVYCIYSQGHFTGKQTDYRDVFIYTRSDNYLKYIDDDGSYYTFVEARNLILNKSVKGRIGTIKE